ncbi:MAG: IS4 family transposase, partial [Thermodesulfobacteriota bacterium]|nr:IS4 family transposase [Thermodesulfobacteriota bacterium]
AGLITYLLLAIYCREQHNEKVSIKRVRELRIKIQNEIRSAAGNRLSEISSNIASSTCYASP